MKLLTCDGLSLEVRELLHGRIIVEDDEARQLLRELQEAGACRPTS